MLEDSLAVEIVLAHRAVLPGAIPQGMDAARRLSPAVAQLQPCGGGRVQVPQPVAEEKQGALQVPVQQLQGRPTGPLVDQHLPGFQPLHRPIVEPVQSPDR